MPTPPTGPTEPVPVPADTPTAPAEPLSPHERGALDPRFESLLKPGARIGDYRVRSIIGRGGMGVVLLAEQLEPVTREVALKLLAGSRLHARAQAWFEVERQMLARLQHPAIAQIFDAGTTPEGVPWFSMELVDGEPLTRFADQHRLSLAARVRLFQRVCLGIQHAHGRGIVHRDLKPANILVAEIDGQPAPKIIDFGIAALQHGAGPGQAPAAGTLAYMSPEQRGRSSDQLEPRADVYALGVILHELLTGELPRPDDALIEATPPQRMAALWQSWDAGVRRSRARLRQTTPAGLQAALHGDLSWIVARALHSQREARYETAAALSEDLARWLDHQPVHAVPGGRLYRMRRYVRRHALSVVLVLVALGALLTGLILALREAKRAEAALAQAEAAVQTSEAVNSFFVHQLHADDPGMQCNDAQYEAAAAAAQRALEQLPLRFPNQPRVQLRVRTLLAGMLLAGGEYTRAVQELRAARSEARTRFGRKDLDTLQVELALAQAYYTSERLDDARIVARSVSNRAADVLGRDHPIYLQAQLELARTLTLLSDYAEARRIIERHLAAVRRLGVLDTVDLQDQYVSALAETLRMLDQDQAAGALLEQRVMRLQQAPGPNAQRTLDAILDLALLQIGKDELDAAETAIRTLVIPVYDRYCGEGIAPSAPWRYLGMIELARGDYAAAVETLAMIVVTPPEYPEAEMTLSDTFPMIDYGAALAGLNLWTAAVEHLERADRILARDVPIRDPDRQRIAALLVDAYTALEDSAQVKRWSARRVPEPVPLQDSAQPNAPAEPSAAQEPP